MTYKVIARVDGGFRLIDTSESFVINVTPESVEDYIAVGYMTSISDMEGFKEALVQNALLKDDDELVYDPKMP